MKEGSASAHILDEHCLQYRPSRLTFLDLKTGQQVQEMSLVAVKYKMVERTERIGAQGKRAPFPLRGGSAIWRLARKPAGMSIRRM